MDPLHTVRVTLNVGVVDVRDARAGIPTAFVLNQNYPNPFNPTTRIEYGLPEESVVRLTVYNLLGQEVTRLIDGQRPVGYFVADWDGTDGLRSKVSSGVYFYKMEATGTRGGQTFMSLKKAILLR
jgi:hypothetical protein